MKTTLATVLGTTMIIAGPALADKAAVLDNYANIAAAKYGDSLTTAQTLQSAVKRPDRSALCRGVASGQNGLAERPRALSADRSVPIWQQGECLAAG